MELLVFIYRIVVLVAAFRLGQGGTSKRPWIVSLVLAIVFTLMAAMTPHSAKEVFLSFLVYLLVCPPVFLLYWRVNGILSTILIAAVGSLVILFGVPFVVALPELAGDL